MRPITTPLPIPVTRGPVVHGRREQIVESARHHFREHGYEKTSVAELARAIEVSSAYVYRFFDSKQAIGEAVCAATLAIVAQRLIALGSATLTPPDKLARFYRLLLDSGYELLIDQRKMHDLVLHAVAQDWISVQNHRRTIRAVLEQIAVEGRTRGDFEAETSLSKTVSALYLAAVPFAHPVLLQQRKLDELRAGVTAITAMVLRSLRP